MTPYINTRLNGRLTKNLQSLCLIIGLAFFSGIKMATAVALVDFPYPSSYAFPTPYDTDFVTGSDGNFWYTDIVKNTVNKMTPNGVLTVYPIPTISAFNDYRYFYGEMILSPDGNCWFLENGVGKISNITPSGAITEYDLPNAAGNLRGLVIGADGNVWTTDLLNNKIFKITSSGTITSYSLPSQLKSQIRDIKQPDGLSYFLETAIISVSPDGNIWFLENSTVPNTSTYPIIAKITPNGIVTEYPVPSGSLIAYFVVGNDGNLWSSESQSSLNGNIYKITPNGVFTAYPAAERGNALDGGTGSLTYNTVRELMADADGNIWFVETNNNSISKMTPNGTVTKYRTRSYSLNHLAIGADGNVWFWQGGLSKNGVLCNITPNGVITEYPDAANTLTRNIPAAGTKNDGGWVTVLSDYYIESSQAISLYGQAVTFTATVSGNNATGTVQFMDDGHSVGSPVTLSNGKAALTLSTLKVATHIITANYSGDAHNPSKVTSALIQTINSNSPNFIAYPLPANTYARAMTNGADDNIWFSLTSGVIGKITLDGTLTSYPLPNKDGQSYANDITAGLDGNVWFTEHDANKIGKITPAGNITEYPLRDKSLPNNIVAGSEGSLWFTTSDNYIGKITPSGTVTEYPITNLITGHVSKGIVLGADGNIWFTEKVVIDPKNPKNDKYFIGKITPSGQYTQYPANQFAYDRLTLGADGKLWFTQLLTDHWQLSKISPEGTITYSDLPVYFEFAIGPDGNQWWWAQAFSPISKINPNGSVMKFTIPNETAEEIIAGPDANMWMTTNSGKIIKILLDHVVSSVNPSAFSQAVTLTASITGNSPTGTLQFMDGASSIGSPITLSGGVATYTTTALTAGSHKLTAVYSGDEQNISQTLSALTQVVGSAPVPPRVASCDANKDGKINVTDLSLIYTAKNTVNPAYDLDGDGKVTIRDVRICVLKCNNVNCQP